MNRPGRLGGVYRFGRFTLDPVARALRFDRAVVHLSALQFDLLHLLVTNSDRLVGKAEARQALWPDRVVEDGNLKQAVFGLRQALARHEPDARLIATISGKGYRLAAPVVFEASGEPITPPEMAAPEGRPAPSRWRVALAAVAIFLIAGLGWLTLGRAAPARSVVCAAFENRTGDPAFDHLPETLIGLDLAQAPGLNLLSATEVKSTLAYMRVDPNGVLSPDLAGEVCRRRDGGVVVDGAVDRLGARYLLTAKAVDCVSGRILASGRDEFASKEAAPAAFDRMAARLRSGLGESFWSLARHRLPVEQRVTTASFAALQAYSQARDLDRTGRTAEELPLLQQAVALDPTFATGWAALASYYGETGRDADAAAAIKTAYALRGTVSDWEALDIDVDYADFAESDPWRAVRSLKAWLAFHDTQGPAWCDLGAVTMDAGHFADAVAPLKRCLALGGANELDFSNLIDALGHADRIDEARSLVGQARLAGALGPQVLLRDAELAFAQGDPGVLSRLAENSDNAWVLYDATDAALAQGRLDQAAELERRAETAALQDGTSPYNQPQYAVELMELGDNAHGSALIAALPDTADPMSLNYALAAFGDPGKAADLLAARLKATPQDPVLRDYEAPRIRAALLARQGKLDQALQQFAAAEDLSAFDSGMDYQLGLLALRAGRPAEAAKAFSAVIDHPGRDPVSPRLPLARLGLARALTNLGEKGGAHAQYQALFKLWSSADRDLTPLIAAHEEDRRLPTGR